MLWQWFTENDIAILLLAIIAIILGLVIRTIFLRNYRNAVRVHKSGGIKKTGGIIFWVVEILSWCMIALSLAAVIYTRTGTAGGITSEDINLWLLGHGIPIFVMLLVGFVVWFGLNRFMPPLIMRIVQRPRQGESMQGMQKRADTLSSVLVGLTKVILVTIILFEILSELGIDIGPILAGFGIVGIAVGFGAQYLVSDLIAGIFIIAENQYRVGDVASVAGYTAQVEEVNLRKTVLRDLDGIVHHIPNGQIKVASNYTRHFSRINLDISLSHDTNLEHAMRVINLIGQELAQDNNWKEKIITPPKALRINRFTDSGIEIKITGDCKPMEQWTITGELRLRLKKAFDREGIEMSWPRLKLNLVKPSVASLVTCNVCSHHCLPDSKFCANCGNPVNPHKEDKEH